MHQPVADEVQRIKILCKNDDPMFFPDQLGEGLCKNIKLTVTRKLLKIANVGLKIKSLSLQLLTASRVSLQVGEPLLLPLKSCLSCCFVVEFGFLVGNVLCKGLRGESGEPVLHSDDGV